jgi:hypothetical protein
MPSNGCYGQMLQVQHPLRESNEIEKILKIFLKLKKKISMKFNGIQWKGQQKTGIWYVVPES